MLIKMCEIISVTIDSACTSAMYGLHIAMQALRDGDCDSAIVASSNWIMDPSMQIAMDKLGALSATSTSHTFDASADGYARGEGFAAIYLKKAEKAMHDGSPIRALVRGSAIGANGRSSGITHPSGAAQEDIIRKAYHNAGGLVPSDTTFLECHGTGTRVGDPLEVEAAGKVFGAGRSTDPDDRLLIGSVKTNLGHTEGAAALASIFKVVLALEAGMIPPSVGVHTLNPKIDFDKAKAKVVTEVTPWPKGKLRRASVTSAGFGGSIGHCIIDHVNVVYPNYLKPDLMIHHMKSLHDLNGLHELPYLKGNGRNAEAQHQKGSATEHLPVLGTPQLQSKGDSSTRQLVLLCFSAHNESSLNANIAALSRVINNHPLADVAYTLGARRSKLTKRAFRIVDKNHAAQGIMEDRQSVFSSPVEIQRLAFIFTGQGAQWHAMGAQLLEYQIFRTTIEQLDQVLALLPGTTPSWTLIDVVSGKCDVELVQTPEVSQPACTALQIGLVDLLAAWSIRPSGVVGHSSGEMAAAYAGGYVTKAEAITAAYFRGQAVSQNKQKGAMLAVGLDLDQACLYLQNFENSIRVAAINSPSSLTLSGDQGPVEELSKILQRDGLFNRTLKTGGNAYHSHHMVTLGGVFESLLEEGMAELEKVGLRDHHRRYPCIPWISSVMPDTKMTDENLPASYWRANLESPVRFSEAVAGLVKEEGHAIGALLEIGPHPALKSPLIQILKSIGRKLPYVGSMKRDQDCRTSMLQAAGTLFSLNAAIDLAAVNGTDGDIGGSLIHGVTAADLPPYQYTYGLISYHESRASKEFRLRQVPRHDLIGSKVAGNAKLRPQFRNVLRIKDLPWLGEHRLSPDAVFPAAGYLSMAMVAASQIHNEFPEAEAFSVAGYSLRNVDIKTALKIPEDQYGIEIMLSLELMNTTTARAPAWATFSISSVIHNSDEWIEHCTGQVKVEVSDDVQIERIITNGAPGPRIVDTRTLYKKFASVGLAYGSAFQALSQVRAHPNSHVMSARLDLMTTSGTVKGGESHYPIHPASLDSVIQLGLLACHGGQAEKLNSAFVPIHISQLYMRAGNAQDWGTAVAAGDLRGLRSAYLQLQLQNQGGDLLLNIEDLRCVRYGLDEQTLNKSSTNGPFSSPFMRMVYQPDFRTLNNRQIRAQFPPPPDNVSHIPALERLETMAGLIAVDVDEKIIKGTHVATQSMLDPKDRYTAWIRRLVDRNRSKEIVMAKKLRADDRPQMIRELYQESVSLVEAKVLLRLYENMRDILTRRKTGEDVLSEGGLLADFLHNSLFLTGAHTQLCNVLDSMSHASPNLKILELNGGRAHTARMVLERLNCGNGIKRYLNYTVTDTCESALKTARRELEGIDDVYFSVLDLEQDPSKQGYKEAAYDVVIASQAVHTASSIVKALENVRRLLRPSGRLVLVEATGSINSIWVGLVGAVRSEYWHAAADDRGESPFVGVDVWDSALRSAGFSGSELVLDDYPQPWTHSTVIVSGLSAGRETCLSQDAGSADIWLLHGRARPQTLLDQLAHKLQERGLTARQIGFDDVVSEVPVNARIIALLDSENLLLDADQHRLDIFKHLANHMASMVWITSTGMARGRSPDGAVVGGLLRTVSTEVPFGRYSSVDLDADNFDMSPEDAEEFLRVLIDQEYGLRRSTNGNESEDREFAWHSGCMWVARLVPEMALKGHAEHHASPVTHGAAILPIDNQGPVRIDFETPGILSSLYFRQNTELLQQPLSPDFIEVKVAAIGLNWKDLALCTGRYDGNNFSSEYAGVVTRVGANAVNHFAVGNRIYGLAKGHFGNFVRVPAGMAKQAGPEDDLIQLATMPVIFMTAVYAFEHLTCLRRGQKVLIQSASGGLGLGAIQLARAIGAEVFAAAGSSEKIRHLVETVGLPPCNVFAARSPAELRRAVAATDNGGFDVILSTAQGEMLYETTRALAPLGHLIDVGRVDVSAAKTIGLELFQKSASFSSFDLVQVVDRSPDLGAQLMKTVDGHYRAGRIGPIHPLNSSSISQLDQTLLGFSKGTHLGKLVVTFSDPRSMVRMVPATPVVGFDPQACYIVAGGLTGLGRSILRWMADRGARDIVVLSRRGGATPEAQELVHDMAKLDVRVRPIECDLARHDQVVRAMTQASHLKPVKGVVHCAVVYEDVSFDRLTLEGWRNGLGAKVMGTKNLHEATRELTLDFFVMTTSILSVVSFATQAAYNAANNFQDQFARYRRQLGLPATAAQLGLINDVGHLSATAVTLDLMDRNKVVTMSESHFLRVLEPAFFPQEATGAISRCSGLKTDPLATTTYVTCMDPAAMAALIQERVTPEAGLASRSSISPRWYSDGRVSLVMRALDDALRHHKEGGTGSGSGSAGSDKVNSARGAAARFRRVFEEAVERMCTAAGADDLAKHRSRALDLVAAAISAEIANMLLMDVVAVNAAQGVVHLGVDSLIAAELRHWLRLALGFEISMVDLLDSRKSIAALATEVVDTAISEMKL